MTITWELLPLEGDCADVRGEWGYWGWRKHYRFRQDAERAVAWLQAQTDAGMDPDEAVRRLREGRLS
jgi:hypothetical protein